MKTKWLRIGSLVVLLGLIAAIPASTQVLFGSSSGGDAGSNLSLLVVVNRLELTPEQMAEIHGLLAGLLEERDALELRRAELEEDMIAFTGTAEELDEILEAFRVETEEHIDAACEYTQDTIDQIKEILTLKQGEILQELVPGLLADRAASALQSRGRGAVLGQRAGRAGGFQMPFGQQDEDSEPSLRERLFEQMKERLGDNPEIRERLQQRIGGFAPCGDLLGGMQRGGAGMPFGGRGAMMDRNSGGRGQFGSGVEQSFGGVNMRTAVQAGGTQHRGLDFIEQLVEVLELKLEAID